MKLFFTLTIIIFGSAFANENIEKRALILEFKKRPSIIDLNQVSGLQKESKIKLFDDYESEYFKRLYRFEFEGVETDELNLINRLKINSLIKRVERVFKVDMESIETVPSAISLTSDLFFSNQWGLYNQGQKIFKDIDDIHLEEIRGLAGADIGWKNAFRDLDGKIKENVLVAILDSGIDLEHPDLKNNIYKNEIECKAGKPAFEPKEDKDENGYKGDCSGWDFTSNTEGGDNRPEDDLGHGTHVAGIIAAVSDNKIGISGLSNRLKILPIKVLKKDKNGDKSVNGSLTDRIAKGLLYALKKDAKVINMSLGWPLILDTEYLRATIKEVLNHNITIVAAAGNNNNNSPIFPCAYKGVICVGSMSNDGSISNFSNFGGYVDVIAPGDNILSTYPMKLDPDLFSVKGYEIKNGTSQASPMVAGIAAIIKGINPSVSEDEIKARLFKSALKQNENETKFASFGAANLEGAINSLPAPLILPLFKDIKSVDLLPNSNQFKFPLEIKNYWKEAKSVKVILNAGNTSFELNQKEIDLGGLNEGESKDIFIDGEFENLEADNDLDLNFEILVDGKHTYNFKNNFKVSRSIIGDEAVLSVPINSEGIIAKIGMEHEGATFSLLRTVNDPNFLSLYPFYYVVENTPKEATEKGIFVKILNFEEGEYRKLKNDLFIPNGIKILSLSLKDANYDGVLDFVAESLAAKDEKQFIIYSYFSLGGNPLFGELSHFKFVPEKVVLNQKKMANIPFISEKLGRISIPVFLEEGSIPDIDTKKSSWEQPDFSKSNHLYYLEPVFEEGQIILKTRIIDNWKWEEKLRGELSLKWNDDINILDILPQTSKEQTQGKGRALISVGKNYFTNTYLLEIQLAGNGGVTPLKTDLLKIEGHQSLPVIGLGNNLDFKEGISFFGHYTNSSISISNLDMEVYSNIYRESEQRDHILGPIAVFKKDDELLTFFQTKSNLKLHRFRKNEKEVVVSRPITRFSFIPGQLFTETFYPIVKGTGDNRRPALYIDATQINRNDIYVLTVDDNNQLVSPLKYNIRVPDNCKTMNPIPFGKDRIFSFALFCLEKTEGEGDTKKQIWGFRYLDLK